MFRRTFTRHALDHFVTSTNSASVLRTADARLVVVVDTTLGARRRIAASHRQGGDKRAGSLRLSTYHVVLAVQTLRARSACSASRADARVLTAARDVISGCGQPRPRLEKVHVAR